MNSKGLYTTFHLFLLFLLNSLSNGKKFEYYSLVSLQVMEIDNNDSYNLNFSPVNNEINKDNYHV